jgi:FKBP-type peptidyl-prolyl cis-trans isomerase FkpA
MARTQDRVFAFTLAILFLGTSVATGALVIWQIREDNKAKEVATSLDQSESTINQDSESTEEQEGMLQGTQLAEFTPVATVDSLQKIDLVEGTGEEVKTGASVTAHYTGAVAATGIIFQSSLDGGEPIPFSLNGVIKGWSDGVPGMKVGGKRRLLIPAEMAYGATPPQGSGIPPNAALVFDIELVSVEQ